MSMRKSILRSYVAKPWAVKAVASHFAVMRPQILFLVSLLFLSFNQGAGQAGQNTGKTSDAYSHEQISGKTENMAEGPQGAADANASDNTIADAHCRSP
jgi:hypothetical protein